MDPALTLISIASACALCNVMVTPPAQQLLIASVSFFVLLLGASLALSAYVVWVVALSLILGLTVLSEVGITFYVCLFRPIEFLVASSAADNVTMSKRLHIPGPHINILAAFSMWTADVIGVWIYLNRLFALPLPARGLAVMHSLLLPLKWWSYHRVPPGFRTTMCIIGLSILATAITCSARHQVAVRKTNMPRTNIAAAHASSS